MLRPAPSLRLAALLLLSSSVAVSQAADPADPWDSITWTTDSSGAFLQGVPSAEVEGLTVGQATCLDVAGHAVVVHAPNGTRVGCGVLDSTTFVATVGAYPGYDTSQPGALVVSGTVVVTPELGGGILFTGYLNNGGGFPASSSGGLHIHTGTSCEAADAVGGHFYSIPYSKPELVPADYWTEVQWATDDAGCFNPQVTALAVPTLYYDSAATPQADDLNVNGRCAVVHADNGTRIGCGVINDDPWNAVQYATDAAGAYSGSISVPGYSVVELPEDDDGSAINAYGRAVVVHDSEGTRVLCGCCVADSVSISLTTYPGYSGDLNAAAGSVTVTSETEGITLNANLANLEPLVSGGLHIHSGTTCADASAVGGHLYNPNQAQISRYPGYSGTQVVGGSIAVSQGPTLWSGITSVSSISFDTMLVNKAGMPSSSAGGVHIHVGTSCATADAVGGHLFDPDSTFTIGADDAANETDHTSNCSWFTDPAHNLTDADAPLKCKSYAWVIAVTVMLFAATVSNAGFNMQKLSQRQKKQGLRSWIGVWWGGMFFVAIAGLGDFVALEFGDVTLVTPLGSLTLIANIFMANWFHGEKLYVRDGICTAIILAGNIVTVVFAPHANENYSLEQLFELYEGATFSIFVIVLVVIIASISLFASYATNVARRYGHDSVQYQKLERVHSITYPFIGGVYGSQSVTFTKGVLFIVTDSLSRAEVPFFMAIWQFWPLGILVVMCIVMQMTLMNIGLAKWDAMVVIPVFQSTWTMVSILSGAIVYNEFEAFNNCPPAGDAICTAGGFGLSWIFFFVGLLVSITGVFLLSKRKSNEQPEKNFAIGKKAKPTKDKYAVADTADKHKTEVATGPETEDDEEEKEKTAVTDFSAFRDVLLAPLEGQRTPLSGVTLSVRVIVVEREDTSQRWPFTVLMVTDGAPERPPPPKRALCGPRKRKASFGAARTTAPEAQALTEVGADRTDDEDDGRDAEISDAVAVHLLDVVHSINGVSIWRPGALDLNRIHDQLRAPGAEISVRRIAKIKMDKFCEMPIQCAPKGTPSFTDRIASAVGRHIPWQLPVAALLKEPSFDAVYTAMSPDTTATLPGVDVNVSMVGGLGKAGPRIVDDFKVAEKIAWRRQKLCGLCNYDGVVEPGPAAELHAVTHSVETNRPTTFVLSVDDANDDTTSAFDDEASVDDDDDFGDATGGIGIGSDSSADDEN